MREKERTGSQSDRDRVAGKKAVSKLEEEKKAVCQAVRERGRQ